MREGIEEPSKVFVQQSVTPNFFVKFGELICGGKFAVDEQPRHLEVGGVLCDIFDRVAAVADLLVDPVQDVLEAMGGRNGREA